MATRFSVFIWKCVDPIQDLMVPNGCSTVSRRWRIFSECSSRRCWTASRRCFNANRDKVRGIYDERFCRMWDFYLAGCETSFRYGGYVNFQVQLAKKQDTVPLTRDYIAQWEDAPAVAVASQRGMKAAGSGNDPAPPKMDHTPLGKIFDRGAIVNGAGGFQFLAAGTDIQIAIPVVSEVNSGELALLGLAVRDGRCHSCHDGSQ